MLKIEVALFDMAATTVKDLIKKPDSEEEIPLVIEAYKGAFEAVEIFMSYDEINACRGRDKLEVFIEKVKKYKPDLTEKKQLALADKLLNEYFVPSLLNNLEYIDEIKGTSKLFKYLKDHDIFVATGTGFPYVVADKINKKLKWLEKGLVDMATCGETAGGGRPGPNMINETLVKAGKLKLPKGTDLKTYLSKPVKGFDYSILLKVGDTAKDVEEGLNVGATVIGVLTGTQSREKLANVFDKYGKEAVILSSVREIRDYLESMGYV